MATPEQPGPRRTGGVPPDDDRPSGAAAPNSEAGIDVRRFPFEFSARLAPLAAAFGVTPSRAYVDVGAEQLLVRFGFWSLRTPLANVRDLQTTGPYSWWKVAGPAHLSVADGGVTFATTTAGGVCIQFHDPVPAALPLPVLRHPAATVTVAAPQALIDLINQRRPA